MDILEKIRVPAHPGFDSWRLNGRPLAWLHPASDTEGGNGSGDDKGGEKGDGDKGGGEKTYTQAQVEALMKTRLEQQAKKYADYDVVKEKAGKVDSLETQLAELNAKLEDHGKPPTERERNEIRRETDALRTKLKKAEEEKAEIERLRTEAEQARVRADESLRYHRLSSYVSAALSKSKVIPHATEQATRLLIAETGGRLEVDETGRETLTFKLGDMTFTEADKVAAEWLKRNDWYAQHTGGGSGGRNPNSGGISGKDLDGMSEEALIRAGFSMK